MTREQIDLLPCPFCGGSKILTMPPTCERDSAYDASDRAMPVARCESCYAEVLGANWDITCESAIRAWNKRSPALALHQQCQPAPSVTADQRRPHALDQALGDAIKAWLANDAPIGARDNVHSGHIFWLMQHIKAALTAHDGWQPIETAPKDGTRILAWHQDWETSHTAQWFGTYWGVFYKTGPLLFQPTHWQPLPVPPSQIADQRKEES